jgi:hypothetical protein
VVSAVVGVVVGVVAEVTLGWFWWLVTAVWLVLERSRLAIHTSRDVPGVQIVLESSMPPQFLQEVGVVDVHAHPSERYRMRCMAPSPHGRRTDIERVVT